MTARDLITDQIVPLRPVDSGNMALMLLDEFRLAHLPVVENLELIGIISDTDIYNLGDFDAPVSNILGPVHRIFIRDDQHIYDVIGAFYLNNLTLLPVLDDKNHYIGSITLSNLVNHLARIASIEQPGGIIVLEMPEKNYSAAEIARIVESNDARILSIYITSQQDSALLEVTLKINSIDIGPILQTFNRYNYQVKASFSKKDSYTEDLNERYDALMNYLRI